MRIFLALLLFITTISVEARMYQWIEPGVDTTQLSGKPPAWYRSAAGGPRVFVFDNGRLIDDTAVSVSDEVRQRMRQEAFILAEEDRQRAKEKIAKAKELKKKLARENNEEVDEIDDARNREDTIELLTDALFPEEKREEEQKDENIANKSLEELRSIISDWEESRTESAKQALK